MPLLIGTKKLIPAPILNIQRNVKFAADGSPINTDYSITLNGTLLPNRGSPRSDGFWMSAGDPDNESNITDADRFNSIIKKQSLLRDALAVTGYKLTYSAPGYPTVEFYPTLNSITFDQGPWVVNSTYQISLTAPNLITDSISDQAVWDSGYLNYNLSSIGDSYSVKEREDNTNVLEITRTTNAVSTFTTSYSTGNEPWKLARTWVSNRIASVPFNSGLVGLGITLTTPSGYNLVEEESVDAFAGSYSRSQRFTFHSNNYLETRRISRSFEPALLGDLGPGIERISVEGSIVGYDPNNNVTGKMNAARAYYSGIFPVLGTLVGALGSAVTRTVNEDVNNGTINYISNFINQTGSQYRHTYEVSQNLADNLPLVTIQGSIEGVTPDSFYYGSGTVNYNKFDVAMTGWTAINTTLKNLAFSTSLIPSGSLYANSPSVRNISFNRPNGIINYSYGFGFLGTGVASQNYRHEYSVEYSTDNSLSISAGGTRGGLLTTATINGTIYGLDANGDPTNKVANAKSGYDAIDGDLLNLVNSHYSLIGTNVNPLSSGHTRRVVGLNTSNGIVTYSASFTNTPGPSNANVAVEDVNVEDSLANDIFAVQIIPGRSAGPIIQNIGTVSERRKTINIALTMYPKIGTNGFYSYSDRTTPAAAASGLLSGIVTSLGTRGTDWFIAGDSENWNPKAGFFTKTTSVVYSG